MIGLVFDLQAFQLEHGMDGHENRVVLRGYRTGWRFRQSRIGCQRLMKFFNFPPFLVDRCNIFAIARQITTYQIQPTGAAVFVCKDLPYLTALPVRSPSASRALLAYPLSPVH